MIFFCILYHRKQRELRLNASHQLLVKPSLCTWGPQVNHRIKNSEGPIPNQRPNALDHAHVLTIHLSLRKHHATYVAGLNAALEAKGGAPAKGWTTKGREDMAGNFNITTFYHLNQRYHVATNRKALP